jgi:hypothetical protein
MLTLVGQVVCSVTVSLILRALNDQFSVVVVLSIPFHCLPGRVDDISCGVA